MYWYCNCTYQSACFWYARNVRVKVSLGSIAPIVVSFCCALRTFSAPLSFSKSGDVLSVYEVKLVVRQLFLIAFHSDLFAIADNFCV